MPGFLPIITHWCVAPWRVVRRAPLTHSPRAGWVHPCGLVLRNRSLLSPFHLLLPSWGDINSLVPSELLQSRPPSCPLLPQYGRVAPSAHITGRCGWGVAPMQCAGGCGGPRALPGDVSQPCLWFAGAGKL